MLRTSLSCILLGFVIAPILPVSAADTSISDQVAKFKVGRKIKVKLNDGVTLKGRMGPSTAGQFSLEPPERASGSTRMLQFAEIQSVKPDGLSKTKKWIIGVAVVWIGLAIASSRV